MEITWTIREATSDDSAAIGDLHRDAFGDHGEVVARLADAIVRLTDASRLLSLVAVEDEHLIGHALFSPGILDAPSRMIDVAVLSPVGVATSHQRRGIGRALIAHGLAALKTNGTPLVFLEGDPSYYSRLGFEPGKPLGFRKPSLRIPDPAFQVFQLAAADSRMTGTLVYPQVFWDLDAVGLRD